jgi:tetratricopeptide (TPR) repeat protein
VNPCFGSNTNDRLQESLDLINKAAELDPLSPIIKQNIAMIYGRMGRFTEQEPTFRQLFSADPELSLIHEDPRFKAMDQRARAELARQRENLAYLAPAVHRFPR